MNNFEVKRKLVIEGKSKIFNDWKELSPNLTVEEFLLNLAWVCEDPCENGDGTGRLTREMGLTKEGIVHINRINGEITTMYRADNGRLWSGDNFRVKCTEKFVKNADKVKADFADADGMIVFNYKISLSAKDKV
jgi:hypothetical protein